jgi:hypothetical protein
VQYTCNFKKPFSFSCDVPVMMIAIAVMIAVMLV